MADFDFDVGFKSSPDRLDAIEDRRRYAADRSVPFNLAFLDDIAYGMLPDDLVIVGGATGTGKTELGTTFAMTSAKRGKRVHYFALEAHEGEVESRLLFRLMSHLAWERRIDGRYSFTYAGWRHGRCDHVAQQVYQEARKALAAGIPNMQTYYRKTSFTADDIRKTFLAIQNETDLIVFDHLHYVDTEEQNEIRSVKATMKVLRDTSLSMETPVIAIAHLRKADNRKPRLVPDNSEFHGSSDITKAATKAIALAPAWDLPASESHIANTYIAVTKDRLVGDQRLVALVGYDRRTSMYENKYRLGRLSLDGTEWIELKATERPFWAERMVTA